MPPVSKEDPSPQDAVGPPAGEVAVRTAARGDVAVVELAGELDIAGAEAAGAALREAQDPAGTLEIDLRQLTFMDSTGLKLIVACRHRAEEGGGRVVILAGHGPVRRLLELTGVHEEVELREEPAG